MPRTAMILAAGLGTRMRPITDRMPKPLVKVHGKPLIDHALGALGRAGVARAVVNVHYLADQLEAHLAEREKAGLDPKTVIADERAGLLDSGGGIANAMPLLGDEPFFVLNADTFWIEGLKPNLTMLADAWNAGDMDILLLLADMGKAVGYPGMGDFTMDTEGRLSRRGEKSVAPFAYAGAAIVHPRIFADVPRGAFSLNLLFDRAIEAERLHGIRMEGLWLHVGTPEAIGEAEAAIARSAA